MSMIGSSMSGGQSEGGEDRTTAASESSALSNRVLVEQIFHRDDYERTCLLSQTENFNSLKGQTCTTKICDVFLNERAYCSSGDAELSAFLCEIDPNGNHIIELCCSPDNNKYNDRSFFHFEFEDCVRKIILLPLPISTDFDRKVPRVAQSNHQVAGVILVVVSKRAGVSIHSVVLSRVSQYESFRIAEFSKVSRGSIPDVGIAADVASLIDCGRADESGTYSRNVESVLYIGVLPLRCSSRSHRMDILACPLVCQKSPLFQFKKVGPTRALKRSLILTALGDAINLSIATKKVGNNRDCTISTLFEMELKIVRLPPLHLWESEALRAGDILSIPLNEFSVGRPLAFVPIESLNSSTTSYVVLCQHEDLGGSCTQQQSKSQPAFLEEYEEQSPREATQRGEKIPNQWTITETKNAVLRARRDIMANVLQTFQGSTHVPDQSPEEYACQNSDAHQTTPTNKAGQADSKCSTFSDENFDVNIPSPDTALLDMSEPGISMFSSEESTMTPLVGLGIMGSQETSTFLPKTQLLLITTQHGCRKVDPSNLTATQTIALPSKFSAPLECFTIKECSGTLILAAKQQESSKVTLLRVPLAAGQFVPQDISAETFQPPLHAHRGRDMQSLCMEGNRAESMKLRALSLAKKGTSVGQEDVSDCLEAFEVTTENLEKSRKTSQIPRTRSSAKSDSAIVEKLETIMQTLLQFESTVNRRLDSLEEAMEQNAARLAKLEKQKQKQKQKRPSRVEI